MLIFGTRSASVLLGECGPSACPACEKETNFEGVLKYSYFHIWYLFTILYSKECHIACRNCGEVIRVPNRDFSKYYSSNRIPIRHKFGGLICIGLVVLLIAYGVLVSHFDRQQYAAMLQEPQVKDLYMAKLDRIPDSGYDDKSNTVYGLMRVISVDGDEVLCVVSQQAFSKRSQLRKKIQNGLTQSFFDYDDEQLYSREALQDFLSSNVIVEVQRDGAPVLPDAKDKNDKDDETRRGAVVTTSLLHGKRDAAMINAAALHTS